MNVQYKMAVKVTKTSQKCNAMALYHKINVTSSTFTWKIYAFSKSAQLLHTRLLS